MKDENEAIMSALNTKIEDLKGELVVCKAIMGKRVLSATLNQRLMSPNQRSLKEQGLRRK
ncbi:hypothetical protein J1N35_033948 [Gossypium stocksii]|uniref:Uncharacterized protein n=1 Tax=Gossypium stocksii TaxID=47602 RepID=A0A9D3ZPS6_9ROSI|nr:hypothetical protein J1N35_033948 [Gossypium stocksii]